MTHTHAGPDRPPSRRAGRPALLNTASARSRAGTRVAAASRAGHRGGGGRSAGPQCRTGRAQTSRAEHREQTNKSRPSPFLPHSRRLAVQHGGAGAVGGDATAHLRPGSTFTHQLAAGSGDMPGGEGRLCHKTHTEAPARAYSRLGSRSSDRPETSWTLRNIDSTSSTPQASLKSGQVMRQVRSMPAQLKRMLVEVKGEMAMY